MERTTSKIKKFDRETLREFRAALDQALKPLKMEYGLRTLSVEGIRFSDFSATTKISMSLNTKEATQAEFEDLIRGLAALGIAPTILEKTVRTNSGLGGSIIAVQLRKHKYPIIVKTMDGTKFGFTVGSVMKQHPECKLQKT